MRLAAVLLAVSALRARPQSAPLPDAPAVHTGQDAQVDPLARLPGESDAAYRERLHAQAEHDLKLEEQQRLLVVVPNFNTVLSGRAVALSPEQKWDLAFHNAVDPFNVLGAVFLGGLSEATDSDRGYGWGPTGYLKRFGANLADTVDGAILAGAVYPVLLHQDPRYFRQGTGSKRSRARHALLSAFLCRGDNGRTQVNYSNLLGNLSAGALSNAYYPASERGAGLTFLNSSIVTIEGSAATLAVEFAPDVATWWQNRRGHSGKDSPISTPTPYAPTP